MKFLKSILILLALFNLTHSTSEKTNYDNKLMISNNIRKDFRKEIERGKTCLKRLDKIQSKYDRVYRLMIYVDDNKIIEGEFDTDNVELKNKKFDKGLYISKVSSFNSNDPLSSEIMINDGDYYYLPYRTLSTEFSFVSPWYSNKYLYTIFKRTENETYNIYIYFPYCFMCSSISNAEANKLKDMLNAARQEKQTYITNVKSDANQSASIIVSTKDLIRNLKLKTPIDSQINRLNEELKNNNGNMQDQAKMIQLSNENIQSITQQLADANYVAQKIKSKVNQLAERQQILKNNLATLKNDHTTLLKQQAELQATVKKYEQQYKNEEKNLIREAPQAQGVIDKASSELFSNKNLAGNEENLREVYP